MAYATSAVGMIDENQVKELAALLNSILTISGADSEKGLGDDEEEEKKTSE